jgi:hypothetical protein
VASGSWAPTTIRQTRSVVDRYLHPELGSMRVGELTPSVIDAAYFRLRVSGGGRGQGLSSGTLARVHVVLRSALAQAQRWGWVFDNPVERAHRIKVRKTDRQPPTPGEVATLIGWRAEHDQSLHVFVAVAVSTGARRAQLLAVNGTTSISAVVGSRSSVGGSRVRPARSCRTRRLRDVIRCKLTRSRLRCWRIALIPGGTGMCSVTMTASRWVEARRQSSTARRSMCPSQPVRRLPRHSTSMPRAPFVCRHCWCVDFLTEPHRIHPGGGSWNLRKRKSLAEFWMSG